MAFVGSSKGKKMRANLPALRVDDVAKQLEEWHFTYILVRRCPDLLYIHTYITLHTYIHTYQHFGRAVPGPFIHTYIHYTTYIRTYIQCMVAKRRGVGCRGTV